MCFINTKKQYKYQLILNYKLHNMRIKLQEKRSHTKTDLPKNLEPWSNLNLTYSKIVCLFQQELVIMVTDSKGYSILTKEAGLSLLGKFPQ